MTSEERDRLHIYEIRVRGHLGTKMLRAFPSFDARPQGKDTLLTGRLPDQAAVYGVIAKLESLGLELLELRTGTAGALSPSGEALRDAASKEISTSTRSARNGSHISLELRPGADQPGPARRLHRRRLRRRGRQ